jgi:hypothetical protein
VEDIEWLLEKGKCCIVDFKILGWAYSGEGD